MTKQTQYRGRFAPSPTGLLHQGSLIGALASYLDAKANQGIWLVRMEDLDPPREMPGAAEAILQSLQAHGLQWDEEVLWQSQQYPRYQQAIEQLIQQGHAFYCSCSRTQLAATQGIHRQTCQADSKQACAVRLRVPEQQLGFDDPIQGHFEQQLKQNVGDFVIQRKDQLFAYQLAVVLDDAYQGITHIVRGSDLLDCTPRQLYLQQLMGFPTPHYMHFPVITNQQGQKLSKQTFAPALDSQQATDNLLLALAFLNQTLPPVNLRQHCRDILDWATAHWQADNINKTLAIAES